MMDEFGADWAMFQELGSRAMADIYTENSPVLGAATVRTRAFAAEGVKVTALEKLEGLFFGLKMDPLDKDASDADRNEYSLESQRVYEIQSVLGDGRLLAKVIWPETKDMDAKSGTVWAIRPDAVAWIYHPGVTDGSAVPDWEGQWNALQQSTFARFGE